MIGDFALAVSGLSVWRHRFAHRANRLESSVDGHVPTLRWAASASGMRGVRVGSNCRAAREQTQPRRYTSRHP